MRKLLLSLFAGLLSCSTWANVNVEIDGIYFSLNENTKVASVVCNYPNYSGDVVIPPLVTYSDVTYSVTSIGQTAFSDCIGLTSVVIPNSVTSIGSSAFHNCTSLTSIDIPNSVTSIGSNAFSNTAWYKNQPDGLVYAGKVAYKYKGTMPANTSIDIKDGTTEIIGSAFSGCTGLISVEIPNSVTSIGSSAFYNCTSLTSISIPNSVTSIGGSTFSGCTGLTSIDIPNSVTSIGRNAFDKTAWYNNQPEGLLYVGKVAYTYKGTMPANTPIDIKDGTTEITSSAFSGCTGLTSIDIPNSVNSIGEQAFLGCTGLTSVKIPNGVTSIGMSTFAGCSSLSSIEIPSSVETINSYAFDRCENLEMLHITDITSWCNTVMISQDSHPFYSSEKKIRNIVVNNEIVTNVIIPEEITTLNSYIFYKCNGLKSVEIPNSITSIGRDVFTYCSSLDAIKVNWNRPFVLDRVYPYIFAGVDKKTCTLFVPKGTAIMYMSSEYWNEFENIVEFEDGENAHYITIRMGDGGVLKQSVELGKIYIYKVKADEGWTINTLTFNGQDMTGQLLDGQFSTPVITGDAELNVVFKQEASNIKSMKQTETSKVKVYAYNGTIKVAGAEDDAEVEVYNAGGILVANGEGNCSISLDSGIYIVKVGNDTFKVSL